MNFDSKLRANYYSVGALLSRRKRLGLREFFVAGVTELHPLGSSQQGFGIVLGIPKFGVVRVACDAGNLAAGGQRHVPRDGHGWNNLNGMGKIIVCLLCVAGEVLMALTTGGANLFGIGQLLSVKGQGLMAVQTLGVALVIMDGKGRQGEEKYGDKKDKGTSCFHSVNASIALRRSLMLCARLVREVSSILPVEDVSALTIMSPVSLLIFERR